MFALPILICTVILTIPSLLAIWGTDRFFGPSAGMITGRVAKALIALLPVSIGIECTIAMNVEPVIVGDTI
ncbi:hypothetical protein PSH55_21870, partial [Pseudoalteromonas sp. Angola-31]|nr:hypothetical protein [Pseudoalteromonas sp. Angola-31]